MLTDWLLIRRAAAEIERALLGARVGDIAKLPDGRLAISFWNRGSNSTFCIDLFAPTPLVEIESELEFPIAVDPGFVRGIGAVLRAMTLAGVRARRGDRILALDFTTRSRFGIAGAASLVLELVPRFGNAILLKDDRIVHPLREFSLAENTTRSIQTGQPYQPPDIAGRSLVPRLIAESYSPQEANEIVERFGGPGPPDDPLFVYRREGTLVQAHVVALAGFDDTACTREPSLLALFGEMAAVQIAGAANQTIERRRAALLKPLAAAERKARGELASIAANRARAADRQKLREEGASIYACLHQADPTQREERKDRAAQLFAAYKKLGASLPHLERREAHLNEQLESILTLAWEAQRAGPSDLGDVAEASAAILRPRGVAAPTKKTGSRKHRAPLAWRSPSGSRILVGRTPQENADLTFRVARPEDLWFHVQGQPGAHTILARDDKAPPPHGDLIAAAALAALHSKARASQHVAVDYTARKYVRKRPAAAPGLVFYTNPATLIVTPAEPPPEFIPDGIRKRSN